MAETQIEWTHRRHPVTGEKVEGYTFNPWIGCTAVSRACRLCYAEAMDDRRFSKTLGGATPEAPVSHWGKGAPRIRTRPANWQKPLAWNRRALELGMPLAVFCASLSDWADEEVPDEWRDDLFALIDNTPHLDWLLLTKRTAKARQYITDRGCPPNVWLGATMEDQKSFNERIADLLATPGPARRFASMEPLFEAVDIWPGLIPTEEQQLNPSGCECHANTALHYGRGLDWVIIGGESNMADRKKSWPMHPDDVEHVAVQAWAANVPLFFKQWGDWAPAYALDHNPQAQAMAVTGKVLAHDFERGEAGRRITYNVGKSAGGRTLNGRVHDEAPPIRPLSV